MLYNLKQPTLTRFNAWLLAAFFLFSTILSTQYSIHGESTFYDIDLKASQLLKEPDSFCTTLQAALNEAGDQATESHPWLIHVPAGQYTLTGLLKIYSNTTLILDEDAIITSGGNEDKHLGVMLVNGNYTGASVSEDEYKGYGSYHNITIRGGVWDGNGQAYSTFTPIIFRFAHATNINLQNVTLQNNRGNHHMEAAAIDGLNIENCTFKNALTSGNVIKDTNLEALQIDVSSSDYPGFKTNSQDYDNCPCKNVVVNGCSFENVFRGVGSHHPEFDDNTGIYYENIVISGNTFINTSGVNILGWLWKDSVIKDNIMTDTSVKKECGINLQSCLNCSISGNSISNCQGSGVIIDNSTVTGINENTILNGSKNGISIQASTADQLNRNTISANSGQGINLYNTIAVQINDNSLNNNRGGQIVLNANSDKATSIATISNNTAIGGNYGIVINQDAFCESIVSNKIKDSSRIGIYANHGDVQNIGLVKKGNIISNAENAGISINNGASAKNIQWNQVLSSVQNGILVDGPSTVINALSSNTIKGSGNSGICVTGANCTITALEKNIVTDVKNTGISVGGSSHTITGIKGNKILNPGYDGIHLAGTGNKVSYINSNTITGAKYHGLNISSISSSGKSINSNTITNASLNGISISGYNLTLDSINSNTISGSGNNGILLTKKGNTVAAIDNNTISGATGSGIAVTSNAFVKKTIKSNTIKNIDKNGIYITARAGSIEKNTLSDAQQAIYLKKAAADQVLSNQITRGKNAIVCDQGSVKYISQNTILSPSNYGIKITKTSNLSQVNQNQVTSTGKHGISISTASVADVRNNTINKSGKHGISLTDATISNLTANHVADSAKNGFNLSKTTVSLLEANSSDGGGKYGYYIYKSSQIARSSGNCGTKNKKDNKISDDSTALLYIGDENFYISSGDRQSLPLPLGADANSNLTFASSNKKIASCNSKGTIKGKTNGTVSVSASNETCTADGLNVCVVNPPARVMVKKKKLVLAPTETYTLMPYVNSGATCGKFKYSSNKKKIAKVNSHGIITAKRKGKAVITVMSYNGKKVKVKIKVKINKKIKGEKND